MPAHDHESIALQETCQLCGDCGNVWTEDYEPAQAQGAQRHYQRGRRRGVAGMPRMGAGIINATYEDGLTLGRWARGAGLDYVMSRPPIDGDIQSYFRKLADTVPVMIYVG